MDTADVLIAGAGIIGLSLALDLARSGLRVAVLDRGRAMAEASWAAAGMLAARDPDLPPPLADLANLSLALYPDYLAQIEQLSGRKVPLRTKAAIQAVHDRQAANTPNARLLTLAQARSLEPNLRAPYQSFLLLEESSLDPRDLCAALPAAAIAAGVTLREDTPVLSVDAAAPNPAAASGVVIQTPTGPIAAARFVNCAGAWAESPALGPLPPGHPAIRPAKGQMATVRMRGNATLGHVLRAPEIYLVPRGDGRIAVGATVESAGFDKSVEPHAIARLLRAAAQLWPPIADAEILETWAGLRPNSSDELPLIGPTTNSGAPSRASSPAREAQTPTTPQTWIAAGHFRNGILLAPATARLLSQLIRGETPAIDLAPFAPNRKPAIHRPLETLRPPQSDNPANAAL